MSKPTIPKRARQYADLVAHTGLTRAAFAKVIGVRPECITRRCKGGEQFRDESLLAAKFVAEGGSL